MQTGSCPVPAISLQLFFFFFLGWVGFRLDESEEKRHESGSGVQQRGHLPVHLPHAAQSGGGLMGKMAATWGNMCLMRN